MAGKQFNIVAVLSSNASQFNAGMKSANKSTSVLSKGVKAAGVALAAFAAASKAISIGKELVDIAAQAEGVKKAFDSLNAPGLLDELRESTKGTVNDLELMKAAVKAKNFKIPLEQLATYFKFAQQRARATGESVDFLVESIINGIGRKSPLILDNLGISAVELREEMKKTGDMAKAVSNIINENMGDSVDVAADAMDRYKVSIDNLKSNLGTKLLPIVSRTADALASLIPTDSIAKQEIDSLLLLEEKLKTVNITAEDRNAIYDELLKTHPDVVAGLDRETTTTEALTDRISGYNEERSKSLKIQSLESENLKKINKQTASQNNLNEAGLKLRVKLITSIKDSSSTKFIEAATIALEKLRKKEKLTQLEIFRISSKAANVKGAEVLTRNRLNAALEEYNATNRLTKFYLKERADEIKLLDQEIALYKRESGVIGEVQNNLDAFSRSLAEQTTEFKKWNEQMTQSISNFSKFGVPKFKPETLKEFDELIAYEEIILKNTRLQTKEYQAQLDIVEKLKRNRELALGSVSGREEAVAAVAQAEVDLAIKLNEEQVARDIEDTIDSVLSDLDLKLEGPKVEWDLIEPMQGLTDFMEAWGAAINSVNQSIGSVLSTIADNFQQAKDRELSAVGNNAKKREAIEKKYFEKQKRLRLAEANMSIAAAILQALASAPPPFNFILAGISAVAGAVQLASINSQKFANGGVVYGETLATVGEYAGARNNPEVIAPLNKLKSILGDTSGMSGDVNFVIKGRDLVTLANKENAKQKSYT